MYIFGGGSTLHHKQLGGGEHLPPEGGRERRLLARPPESVTEVLAWILTAQPENALDVLLAVRTEGRSYGMYCVWAVYVYGV